jgi:hypothetical protein
MIRIVSHAGVVYTPLQITLRVCHRYRRDAQALSNGRTVGVDGDTRSHYGGVKGGTKGDRDKAESRGKVGDLHRGCWEEDSGGRSVSWCYWRRKQSEQRGEDASTRVGVGSYLYFAVRCILEESKEEVFSSCILVPLGALHTDDGSEYRQWEFDMLPKLRSPVFGRNVNDFHMFDTRIEGNMND